MMTVRFALTGCLCALASVCDAQVGIGEWTEYHPTGTIQLRGRGTTYVKDSAGIETFTMARGDERSEMRIVNGYKTGVNQFEGYVRVSSGQGTSVHQVFKFLMIVAYPQNGGSLHQHSQTFLVNNAFNRWVRVNTIHYTAAHKAHVFMDGQLKTVMNDHAWDHADGWYNKYGVYNTSSGSKAEWRSVRYFKQTGGPDGSSAILTTFKPARAGASPAIHDLAGRRLADFRGRTGRAAGAYFPWSLGTEAAPGR